MTTFHLDTDTRTGADEPGAPPEPGPRPDAISERHRMVHTVLVAELREPAAAIARTLQRLSLQRISPVPGVEGPAATHLLRRARQLSSELQATIDELLESRGGSEGRTPQHTVLLLGAIDDALAETRPHLRRRPVAVDCPERLAITTGTARLHQLLVCMLTEAARHPDGAEAVTLCARRHDDEIRLEVGGMDAATPDAGRGLELLQSLATALGGRIDVISHRGQSTLALRIPQQRARDGRLGGERTDAGSALERRA